jgi:hypothetical protein
MAIILRKLIKLSPITMGAAIITAVTLFFLPGALAQTAEEKAAEPRKPISQPSQAIIPVAEVSRKVTEVSNLLRTFSIKLAPSTQIEAIGTSLPRVSGEIERQLPATAARQP